MEQTILFQGAESKIYLDNYVGKTVLIKERFQKKYRNPQLDLSLAKERIKAESKNMEKCRKAGIKTPEVFKTDLEKRQIHMEYFKDSQTTKQVIDRLHSEDTQESQARLKDLAEKIGRDLAKMHGRGIVHGDLTTSNMLVDNDQLIFIDFGLSSSNANHEAKGVDLYVLERALLSTHENVDAFFGNVLAAYKTQAGDAAEKVMLRFEDVRARGRKRTMVG